MTVDEHSTRAVSRARSVAPGDRAVSGQLSVAGREPQHEPPVDAATEAAEKSATAPDVVATTANNTAGPAGETTTPTAGPSASATPFKAYTLLVAVAAVLVSIYASRTPYHLPTPWWVLGIGYVVYVYALVLRDRSQQILSPRLGDVPDIFVGIPLLVLGPFPAFAVASAAFGLALSVRLRARPWSCAFNMAQLVLAAAVAHVVLDVIAPDAAFTVTWRGALAVVVATIVREVVGEIVTVIAFPLDGAPISVDLGEELRRYASNLVSVIVALAVIDLAHHDAVGALIGMGVLGATLASGELATREANQRWLAEAVGVSGERIRAATTLDEVLDRLAQEVARLWQATRWHVQPVGTSAGQGPSRDRAATTLPLVRGHEIVITAPSLGVSASQMRSTTTTLVRMADERDRVLRFQRRLELQASRDDLTGLGNRTRLWELLDAALPAVSPARRLAAVYIDIYRFKSVNDTYGHVVGDALLRAVAQRLDGLPNTTEHPVRLSGDEFVVIVENAPDDDRLVAWGHEIVERLGRPYEVDGTVVDASVCLGIAVADSPMDRSELLAATDAAVARAKKSGRGSVVLATDEVVAESRRRLRLESEIRTALATPEFALHYQPIVDTDLGRVVAVEALIRWFRDGKVWLRPDEFIAQAEENGLVTQIGLWVLRQACTDMLAWNTRYRPDEPLAVSINVSTVHIAQPTFVQDVADILDETGFPPELLIIEITETFALLDLDKCIALGAQLKAMGVALWLDDFGTGYSSLEYVRQLPVEVVKLDRSFIVDLGSDATTRTFIESLVALCRSIDRQPMAEGVERPEQRALLAELGCTVQQGYHFAKPMPIGELADYVVRSDTSVRTHRSA